MVTVWTAEQLSSDVTATPLQGHRNTGKCKVFYYVRSVEQSFVRTQQTQLPALQHFPSFQYLSSPFAYVFNTVHN